MGDQPQERHVLVIENGGAPRAISLQAVAYSIGRDPSNAIFLDFDTLSRQHALLLRVPNPGKNSYNYRLVDGNAAGKASTNGVFINGKRCATHTLVNGDQIGLGHKVKGRYFKVGEEPNEFSAYLQSIEYQSLKAEQVNSKATLVTEPQPTPVAAAIASTTVAMPSPLPSSTAAKTPVPIASPARTPHPLEALMSEDEEITLINTGNRVAEDSFVVTPGVPTASSMSSAVAEPSLPVIDAVGSAKDTLHEIESSRLRKLVPWLVGGVCLFVVVAGTGCLLASRSGQAPTQPVSPQSVR